MNPSDQDPVKGALPPGQDTANPIRVEVTGVMPDVRIDPDLTEGHPGYQESGDSELTPPVRPQKPTS